MDYNKLMAELDKTLGLEKASMESANKPKTRPIRIKKAFEGYDEIETELARELGLKPEKKAPQKRVAKESEEDLIFLDGEETSEPSTEPAVEEDFSPEDIFKESVKAYKDSLSEEMEPEEIKEKLCGIISEIVCPDCEEVEAEEVEEESAEEATTSESNEQPAVETSLTDRLLDLGKKAGANESLEEESAEEGQEAIGDSEKDDPDAAFEAMEAKMLSRYSDLAKKNSKSKSGSATEGQTVVEAVIDEEALRRTSCEFAYSSHHLRNMVTEAIKKGVI